MLVAAVFFFIGTKYRRDLLFDRRKERTKKSIDDDRLTDLILCDVIHACREEDGVPLIFMSTRF